MQYEVYILRSLKTNRYYIGQTENLPKRLEEHNNGKSRYTKSGIPWTIVYTEIHRTRKAAIKRETKLKKFKKRAVIEKLIAG